MKNSLHGKNGADLILSFPVGTILINLATKEEISIDKEGEKVLFLKGGGGGYGNEQFKSSTNRTPKERTLGKPGEAGIISLNFACSPMSDLSVCQMPVKPVS